MSTGPKQRPSTTPRGGKREGSGRKHTFGLSEAALRKLFLALKKQAKEAGQSWQENFAKHLYSEDWRESAAFHRMLTDQIKVNKQEKNINVTKHDSPTIYLPEEKPDPAKVVPIKQVS